MEVIELALTTRERERERERYDTTVVSRCNGMLFGTVRGRLVIIPRHWKDVSLVSLKRGPGTTVFSRAGKSCQLLVINFKRVPKTLHRPSSATFYGDVV